MNVIHVPRSSTWLPPSLIEMPGEIRHTFRFSEPERKVFRKYRKIPVSVWSERYRYVTLSNRPGKWKNSVTPYLVGIMDASFFPSVRTIIVCKPPQVGVTEAVLNCIGYAIDRDPGPAMLIYPDEHTADENIRDRVLPMIKKSPRLRTYLTGLDDDNALKKISLQHMPIYTAWARSAARLGNKPVRYLVFDETDKYPDTAGKRESSPISLGEARTITYRHNCKKWKISTPTIEVGIIWHALMKEAQVIFDYYVSCPFCHEEQKMVFAQIKWPKKAEPGPDGKQHSEDPETIEAGELARYECLHCRAEWNNFDRDMAVAAGRWRERRKDRESDGQGAMGQPLMEYLRRHQPVKIGFHFPSFISSFVSLSEPAATFLRGMTSLSELKDFHNKHEATPWKLTIISKDKEKILSACSTVPKQTVPDTAIALTCGVDMQLYGFWFVVRAWSRILTSWKIHYGFLETFDDVERLLFESAYPIGNTGNHMRIFRALMDTGGGRKNENTTMTEEAYFWLLKNRGRGGLALWGSKGASTALPGMLSLGNSIMSTPSGKKLPGALRVLFVDTEKAKDQFHYRLQLACDPATRDMPGAAFLHADTGDDYVAQILAEEKRLDDKGREVWMNPHNRPNHLLDAELLAAACVEMEFPGGGLRLLAENMKRQGEGGERKPASKAKVARSNWMNRR